MDYVALEITARRLIKSNGLPVTFKREVSTLDPETGAGAVTSTEVTAVALAFNVGPSDEVKVPELRGKRARKLVCALDGAVAAGDTVVWDGWIHRVINVTNISPAGVSVYSEVYIEAA